MCNKSNWSETAAHVIGSIGGTISIIAAAVALVQYTIREPKLQIQRASDVIVAYEPGRRTFSLTLGLVIQNVGTESETIKRVDAQLSVAGDPSRHIGFSDPEISFLQERSEVPKNIPIAKDSYKAVTCRIAKHLPEPEQELQKHYETKRELDIRITGSNKTYSTKLCFDIGSDVAKDLFEKGKELTFKNSECQ